MFILPLEFISNVQGVLQEDGRRYVDALPDLVAEASAQWGLMDVRPVPKLSYNFVAFANRGESQVILKIGLPNRETWSEMAALRLFNGGTGPLDQKLVERAESSVKDFFAENHHPVLMHGDFHHFNILSSERGWLVIDPKGVIGPACYEVGPLMMNPWGSISDGGRLKVQIKKRIDILHEYLGFERERIREWALAHAVLSAWWGIEENTGWEYAMQFAEMIAAL